MGENERPAGPSISALTRLLGATFGCNLSPADRKPEPAVIARPGLSLHNRATSTTSLFEPARVDFTDRRARLSNRNRINEIDSLAISDYATPLSCLPTRKLSSSRLIRPFSSAPSRYAGIVVTM